MVTLGFRLAYDYNLPSIGFGILKLKTPTKVIPGIKHSTVDRELDSGTGPRAFLGSLDRRLYSYAKNRRSMIKGTYKIHIFEPPVRGDGAIIAIHGGGWVLADVPMSYKLFSNMPWRRIQ